MRSALPFAGSLALLVAFGPGAAVAQQPPQSAPAATPAAPQPAATAATAQPANAAKPATAAKGTTVVQAQAAAPKVAAKPKATKKKKAKAGPITGPIATYPAFRMLDGGGSRVSVMLSKKVTITEHKAEGKLTYRIAGVTVPTRTNRLPLLTTFFASPVTKAELKENDGDVDLVIDVKSGTTAQHRIVESERGVELQVDFPKLADATKEKESAGVDGGSATGQQSAGRPTSVKSLDSKSDSAY